jgi:hypothetical protein
MSTQFQDNGISSNAINNQLTPPPAVRNPNKYNSTIV